MTDHDSIAQAQSEADQVGEEQGSGTGFARQLPVVLFAIASVAFLIYLAIGSVEARIWRFNRLYFEDRTIREVWAHFGANLPEMPGQPIFTALFWISLIVMVVGTIAGLWLFLGTKDDEPARPHPSPEAGTSSSHV